MTRRASAPRVTYGGVARAALLVAALAVPAVTLPALPEVSLLPALLGLLPWVVGKYVLCPLRWYAIGESGRSRRWHLRAFAEAELLGLATPGHVGADLWRVRRLHGTGMATPSGLAEVALDRVVGAVGLAAFVALAGTTLPLGLLLPALGAGAALALTVLVVHRVRPQWVPERRLPAPRRLAAGVLLSMGYQASVVALLLGCLAATGHHVAPAAIAGAFAASQLAGALPGPHGASPKDAALAAALAALGVPWQAAVGAVALKAALAWLPGVLLGAPALLLTRRAARLAPVEPLAAHRREPVPSLAAAA
ncbi:lysylphosphatidylglycerol synthase domain-containing protein [Vallicoccus soli]|uniref:Uncharacterized protein n=1 Tax=Vallicoccus soli TaxID=2339232 RepID=A0A3A3Z011_9ACTN|nr:lysylphosphatidylglycerol synthase domain-containing protein [Vallicoccus soli]RJK94782.1 hypothetical protein D5H78_13210 [Vallicoccus soli]